MVRINSIISLITGVMIGWFSNQMVTAQIVQRADQPARPFLDLSVQEENYAGRSPANLPLQPALSEDESFAEQFFTNDSLGG